MYNELEIKKMTQKEQEMFTAMVAEKCQQALAPLYAELEELRTKYYPTMEKVEPTPTPEEVEEAEFMKQLQEMKEMLVKSGRIPKDEANN